MSTSRRVQCARAFADADVERDADGVPTAFRIWRSGPNPTDHGVHVFSERSAKLLMAEQEARQNLYSIDVDHMSLNAQAPPEHHKAVGWHRLAVRGVDLWAVDVAWAECVRAGLAASVPEWRYFSPAYSVDKDGEIVGYLNTALTNQPATWGVTALARRRSSMADTETVLASKRYESILADLMGADEEKKAKAVAALAAAFPDEDEPKSEPDGDEEKKPKAKAAAEDGDEDKKAATAKAVDEAATKASAKLLQTIGDQDRRLRELEAIREAHERRTVLATRPDLTAAQLKALEDEPVARLPKLLALIPAPAPDLAAAQQVTATRGAGRDGDGVSMVRAARLPPAEHQALREAFGAAPTDRAPVWQRNDLVFPTLTKEEARKVLAARGLAPAVGANIHPDVITAARQRALAGLGGQK